MRGELDVHFGMPMNGDDVKLIGVDVCVFEDGVVIVRYIGIFFNGFSWG